MRWIGVLVTSVFVLSCSTAPVKQPAPKSSPKTVEELNRIQKEAGKAKAEVTAKRLNTFITNHPSEEMTGAAQISLGNLHFQRQDFAMAYQTYMQVVSAKVESPRHNEALILAARSLFHMGRYDESLGLIQRGLRRPMSELEQVQARELRFVIQNQLGNRTEALRDLVYLAAKHPQTDKRERYISKGVEITETKLDESELNKISRDGEFGFLQAYAYYRLGLIALEKNEISRARDMMFYAKAKTNSAELSEKVSQMTAQIEARQRVRSNTIGVVLPLTGKYQAMGYRSLHGIQLALGVAGSRSSPYRLAVVDSEGNPDVARKAVERLVFEDSVIAIIGGLLSRTAPLEASKAQEMGVPLIALSQSSGVTEIGSGIFRNAFTSQMQVRNLVSVAMEKLGLKSFAILFPNDAYGVEFSNLFWDEVLARGGKIAGAQSYDPKETDFREPVRKLVGTYYPEERAHEYQLRLKEWKEKQNRRSMKKPPENLLPPIVDFEAVFIPDSARAIGQIAPMMAYNDIEGVRLIGTNLWNTGDFVKRGQKFVEKAVFVDSIMENDPALKASKFFSDFKQAFGEEPGLFELQAYDSALILRQIVSDGVSTRYGVIERLSRLNNAAGALGPLTMNPYREVIRPMVNLTVEKGEILKAEF